MIRAKHFSIQEYVPRHIYELRGEKAWELIDPRLILLNDTIREFINSPMVINTWHSEGLVKAYGHRQWSGFRTAEFYRDDKPKNTPEQNEHRMLIRYERSLSQHKYGRASDAIFRDFTAEEIRIAVLADPDIFPLITEIESDVSWFHGGVRNCTPIKVF